MRVNRFALLNLLYSADHATALAQLYAAGLFEIKPNPRPSMFFAGAVVYEAGYYETAGTINDPAAVVFLTVFGVAMLYEGTRAPGVQHYFSNLIKTRGLRNG